MKRRTKRKCTRCKNVFKGRIKTCPSCRETKRKWLAARRASGICISCPNSIQYWEEGKAQCEECRYKNADNLREFYKRRKAAGICTRCTNRAVEGLTICNPCRKKKKEYR